MTSGGNNFNDFPENQLAANMQDRCSCLQVKTWHHFNTICPRPKNRTFGIPGRPRPGQWGQNMGRPGKYGTVGNHTCYGVTLLIWCNDTTVPLSRNTIGKHTRCKQNYRIYWNSSALKNERWFILSCSTKESAVIYTPICVHHRTHIGVHHSNQIFDCNKLHWKQSRNQRKLLSRQKKLQLQVL